MKKFFTFVAAAFAALTINAEDITCAAAVEAGNALGDNITDSTAMISVVGYVSIAEPWNSTYGNQNFYMADDSASTSKAFEAYATTTPTEAGVKRGDKVRVTGYLTKYVSQAGTVQVEIKKGTCEILQAAEEQEPQTMQLYTVSEFITAFDNGTIIEGDSCMVVGVISRWYSKSSKFDQYHSVSYFITDGTNEFEMYNSYSVNKALYATYEYTDENTATCIDENGIEFHIGDSIIGIGTAKKYGTTYEFGQNCYLVWTNAAGSGTPVEQADVVFTSADFNGQGTSGTGSEVTATKDGITFTCDKAYGDQYGVRCYKNGVLTISSTEQQIGKIVFEFATVNGKTYDGGGMDAEIVVNGTEWSATMAEQARMNKISIYFGEYEQEQVDTLTAAQALEIAQGLAVGETQKVVVKAYVAKVKTPYSAEYGNISVYLTDDPTSTYGDIQAYQAKCSAEDGAAIAEHDLVLVEGNVTHTQNQEGTKDYYEIAKGAQLKLLEKAQGIENVVLTEKAQKVVVDGVMYIIRDNKLFTVQGTEVR